MKLRVLDNKLRFRLGPSEVENFGRLGTIEAAVRFGPDSGGDLTYRLSAEGDVFSAKFSDGTITVSIPKEIADKWVSGDEISLEGSQRIDDSAELKFLIEKDFTCLNAHNDEDQTDRYPHPKAGGDC